MLVNKRYKKLLDKKCHFCPCDNYAALKLHRIIPGKDGGKYTDYNTITVCAICHDRIHAGQIIILGKHHSTIGKFVIQFVEDGEEKWV